LLAVAASSVMAALALLRLSVADVADWYVEVPPGLIDRWLDPTLSAILSLLLGVAGIAVSLRAYAAEHGGTRARAGTRLAAAALACGTILLAPGGVIPAAGYVFAFVTVALVISAVVLLTVRHPLIGIAVTAVVVVIVATGAHLLDAGLFVPRVVVALGEQLPFIGTTAAYLVVAAALVLWAIGAARPPYGRFAAFVLRRRTWITVLAAACALPYTIARASWLTHWPLFGGSAELFAREPAMLPTGLLLGAAMLTGGVLTLGLILPWGERFSPWLAVLGGRPVPVGLAVIPAVVVAVLFFANGLEFLLTGLENTGREGLPFLEIVLLFPFWLWGPLLALAAWGYAMHRATQPIAPSRPHGRQARKSRKVDADRDRERRLAELDALEDREPRPLR